MGGGKNIGLTIQEIHMQDLALQADEIPADSQQKIQHGEEMLLFPCEGIPYLFDMKAGVIERLHYLKDDILTDEIVKCRSFGKMMKFIMDDTNEEKFGTTNLGYYIFNLPYESAIGVTHNFRINLKPLAWTVQKIAWLFIARIDISYKKDHQIHLLFYDRSTRGTKYYEPATGKWLTETHLELSEIEKEIMLYAIAGYKSAEIARVLAYTTKSIERFRYTIFDKLGVKNIAEATDICLKHHLLE